MTTKQSNQYDEIEYAAFCDGLEKQYKQAKEQGLFEILKVLDLDKKHSDKNLVQAIDYFNEKDGIVEEKDAPMDFLTEREKNMINRDGKFRPGLYCMLLSTKFAEAIQNKSAFLQHSFKYALDS
jgi:hypothetical protein